MAPPARAEAIPQAIAPNIITSLKWLETNNLFNNLIQRNQSAAFSSGKVRPNHETNINIIARRTGKDVNSHTVLDGIITTIMATIQRINIIGSREGKSVDRKSGSAGMPRPISYAVFCLKKKMTVLSAGPAGRVQFLKSYKKERIICFTHPATYPVDARTQVDHSFD